MGRPTEHPDDGLMKILLLPLLLISPACSIDVDLGSDTIVGSGVERTDTMTFGADVDRLAVGAVVEVIVDIDPTISTSTVVLTGDDNVLDELEVTQDGSTLGIDTRDDIGFELERRPVAIVTVASLTSLDVGGVADVTVEELDGLDLSVDARDAARVELAGAIEALEIDASGVALVRHRGSADTAELTASGGSTVEVDGPVQRTSVDGSGVSTMRIDTVAVTGDLSGGSRLRLTGDTSEIRVDTSGASTVD